MEDQEEKKYPVDVTICQGRCQHYFFDYSFAVDHNPHPSITSGKVTISGKDWCNLKHEAIKGLQAFTSCPFYLEHFLVGGNGQFITDFPAFPVSKLVGSTLTFRKDSGSNISHWIGKVLKITPRGFILDRHDIKDGRLCNRQNAFLTMGVLMKLWINFRLVREGTEGEEIVRFVNE